MTGTVQSGVRQAWEAQSRARARTKGRLHKLEESKQRMKKVQTGVNACSVGVDEVWLCSVTVTVRVYRSHPTGLGQADCKQRSGRADHATPRARLKLRAGGSGARYGYANVKL